ncbi:ABC-F family ATP-binding cassette domain-containing protein [Clostridium sp. 19966]|uniref:ribosomal protection-like ABC-F family protein n=1 Tax=Clostridium sp. 19966 TaxID=2768166 RepID=UPI0028DE3917|nr:ABC-F family ATP-binding cassette domain-containing protein [Clostridium sp. 19966]MDT8717935.1 ABC-F family ATP-binding cassette domain-containing protein [Clostridium sp. 19966]
MILEMNNVGISFEGKTILSNINLKVEKKEKIGLIGVNGAGKSTLLKIIIGEHTDFTGNVINRSFDELGYLKQDNGLSLNNTIYEELLDAFSDLLIIEKQLRELENKMADPKVYDNAKELRSISEKYSRKMEYFEIHGGYSINEKINTIFNGMSFNNSSLETLVSSLSGGEKNKLALAKLLLKEPSFLILDEPTNHLDFIALSWLEKYLKNYNGAILVVSHDRYFLDALVDSIWEMERGILTKYTGNYSKYVEIKAKNQEKQLKDYEMQQQEIKRLQTFVDTHIVRATSSKAAKNKRNIINRMDKIDKPQAELKRTKMEFSLEQKSHKDVLFVSNGSICVGDGINRKKLLDSLNLSVYRSDKVAILGPNGTGKSTLLKALMGYINLDSGALYWGKDISIGYYDQEHQNLRAENTVLNELWQECPDDKEGNIRNILGRFLFSGEDVYKKIQALSGGEKARVALAKLMLKQANVLILDEPTNHLDIFSKEVLEKALTKYEGTIIFVSHDRYFINKIATKVCVLSSHGIKTINGNYEDYMAAASQ